MRRERVGIFIAATVIAGLVSASGPLAAQEPVSFATQDGGTIQGETYGRGETGVVLAHGGRFNKESWAPQARILEQNGFRVLAIDFRGYGRSVGPGQGDIFTAPLHLDVLAAVRYLRASGVKTVAVIGGSIGGWTAANAVAEASPGAINRVVLLGAEPGREPEKLRVPTLFIVTRNDASAAGPRLPAIQAGFDKAPEPKRMVILEGSAHAQFMFQTPLADRVMQEIVQFLLQP
jgi:pimeloyl-ACP methyl ester carboxylesterase